MPWFILIAACLNLFFSSLLGVSLRATSRGFGSQKKHYGSPGRRAAVVHNCQDQEVVRHLLERLATHDPQKSWIVELRFFGGLTIEETAEVLEISHATVEREWKMARAWLRRELS